MNRAYLELDQICISSLGLGAGLAELGSTWWLVLPLDPALSRPGKCCEFSCPEDNWVIEGAKERGERLADRALGADICRRSHLAPLSLLTTDAAYKFSFQVASASSLSMHCSDVYLYESSLQPDQFGSLPKLEVK